MSNQTIEHFINKVTTMCQNETQELVLSAHEARDLKNSLEVVLQQVRDLNNKILLQKIQNDLIRSDVYSSPWT